MTIEMNISRSAGEVSKRPILSNADNGELEKSLYIYISIHQSLKIYDESAIILCIENKFYQTNSAE